MARPAGWSGNSCFLGGPAPRRHDVIAFITLQRGETEKQGLAEVVSEPGIKTSLPGCWPRSPRCRNKAALSHSPGLGAPEDPEPRGLSANRKFQARVLPGGAEGKDRKRAVATGPLVILNLASLGPLLPETEPDLDPARALFAQWKQETRLCFCFFSTSRCPAEHRGLRTLGRPLLELNAGGRASVSCHFSQGVLPTTRKYLSVDATGENGITESDRTSVERRDLWGQLGASRSAPFRLQFMLL